MLSFIICTYNREKYIYQCLSRLARNRAECEWEIVLVDNNSTDSTAQECKRFEHDFAPDNYRYFLETNQGLSFARNRGIKEAKGDWLIFLDDDAFVGDDYIDRLHHQLLAHHDAKAFGGKIVPLFEGETPAWIGKWSMGFVSAIDKGKDAVLFEGNSYPIGANMGISRDAIDQCGDFNTELGRNGSALLLGGEEKDLFGRIREAGLQIWYFPDIPVQHCIPPHRTTKEFISRLGYGVGVSEKLRTRRLGNKAYAKRIFSEIIKWGGTLVIWLAYLCMLKPQKGNILVLFRLNVTKGLL